MTTINGNGWGKIILVNIITLIALALIFYGTTTEKNKNQDLLINEIKVNHEMDMTKISNEKASKETVNAQFDAIKAQLNRIEGKLN